MKLKHNWKKLIKSNPEFYKKLNEITYTWGDKRNNLGKSIAKQENELKPLVSFCRVCIDYNNFLRQNQEIFKNAGVDSSPILEQLKKDLNYCATEKKTRESLKELGFLKGVKD